MSMDVESRLGSSIDSSMDITLERISALSAERPVSTRTATSSSAAHAPCTVKALGILIILVVAACLVYFLVLFDAPGESSSDPVIENSFIGGVNLQPSYYNDGNVTMGWETMKNFSEVQGVRIEVEPDMVEQGREWIRQASEQGYHMIVTYHKRDVLGTDDTAQLDAAAQWWQTNYANLSSVGSFELNLMNEWGSHGISPESFADAYNAAIAVVRTVYSGPIVVDIPGWGQETDTAVSASPLITDQNIVYSAHIYPQAYNQVAGRYVTPGDMENMLRQSGRPCIVGEFGDIQPDPVGSGACDVKAVVEAAKAAGFKSVYGWAWNGDGGSLNMVTPSWTAQPMASEYTVSNYFWPILELLDPPGPSSLPTSAPTGQPTGMPTAFDVMGGVNLQPSYYNNGDVTFGWETMKNFSEIESVRIEVVPDMVEQGREWIRQASEQGYHMIVTYHKDSVQGSDNVTELLLAAEWWQTNYASLSEFGTFDVSIMNKWGSHSVSASAFADAYNAAIAVVRTVYSGPLVVDIPGWGQETDTAVSASPQISDQNIVYSAHIFPQSYNQVAGRFVTTGDVEGMFQNTGRPCIVSQFGNIQPDPVGSGACDVKAVVEAAKAIGYKAVYGWGWNGDGGSLNMVTPTWTLNPTASVYTVTNYSWPILELLA